MIEIALSLSLLAQVACPSATLPAYAHNDYNNSRPVLDAVALGYRGVEADLFLVNGVLRIGHSLSEAERGGSFESVYVRPLKLMIESCRGIICRRNAWRSFLLDGILMGKSNSRFSTV